MFWYLVHILENGISEKLGRESSRPKDFDFENNLW